MPYDEVPSKYPVVHAEWLDITGDSGSPGLTRRWSLGHLLSTTHISEGVECTVLGSTWDEDGWTDYDTFPNTVVLSLENV